MPKARKMLALAIAVLGAISLMLLAGCGSSEEDVKKEIEDDLTAQFEMIKNCDMELIGELIEGDESWEELAGYGITPEVFCEAYFDGFDYSLGPIELNDDMTVGTVELSFVCKNYEDILAYFETELENVDYLELVDMSEDELGKWVGSLIIDVVDKTEAAPLDPITVTVQKNDDGVWDLDEAGRKALDKALLDM